MLKCDWCSQDVKKRIKLTWAESQCTSSYPIVHMKVKVKVSLCFNWAPRHEGVLGEWRYSSTHSLTSALDGGEWSASLPGRFTPRGRVPNNTHWIGGWVGPRAVLGAVVKRKIPSPRRESNPRSPIIQSYTDWAIRALTSRTCSQRNYQILDKTPKNLDLCQILHFIYFVCVWTYSA
jgi:hypothetical protein